MTATESGGDVLQERIQQAKSVLADTPTSASQAGQALLEVAREFDKPDAVFAAFQETMSQTLALATMEALALVATKFVEEWYGKDSAELEWVLRRLVDAHPGSKFALSRATTLYTLKANWDALFALIDASLRRLDDGKRRAEVLEEAVQIARDFANHPARSVSYMKQLVDLRPGDTALLSNLERILERQEMFAELAEVLAQRIENGEPELPLRKRIFQLYRASLGDLAGALREAQNIESIDSAFALQAYEDILEASAAPNEVRQQSLEFLEQAYRTRPNDAIRALEKALKWSTQAGAEYANEVRRERLALADLYEAKGALSEAYTELGKVFVLHPSLDELRERLRHLALSEERDVEFAELCVEAANNSRSTFRQEELRVDAAETFFATGDRDLYQRARALLLPIVLDDAEFDFTKTSPHVQRIKLVRKAAALLANHLEDADEDKLRAVEVLTRVEFDRTDRRRSLGQLARLAEQRGALERAIAAWRARIELEPHDLEALDAVIRLLESEERFAELAEAIRERTRADVPRSLKRADLVHLATLLAGPLESPTQAIQVWQEIESEFGRDREVTDALAELYRTVGDDVALESILSDATREEATRTASLLTQLATVRRTGDAEKKKLSVEGFARAIKLNPGYRAAQVGLRELLNDAAVGASAARALSDALTVTGSTEEWLDLVPHLVGAAENVEDKTRIYRVAARACLGARDAASDALQHLVEAYALSPFDTTLQEDVAQVAEKAVEQGDAQAWNTVYGALLRAIAEAQPRSARTVALERRKAAMLEEHGSAVAENAAEQALQTWRDIFAFTKEEQAFLEARRLAFQSQDLHGLAELVLQRQLDVGVAEATPLDALWQDVHSADLAEAFLPVVESVLAERFRSADAAGAIREQGIALVFELAFRRLGTWCEEQRQLQAAVRALKQALRLRPNETAVLRQLAGILRDLGDVELPSVLEELYHTDPDDFDPLAEAAEVLMQTDKLAAENLLERLFRDTALAFRTGRPTTGERRPDELAVWSSSELVKLFLERSEAARAVDVLMQASRLPVDQETQRALRRRAGDVARDRLKNDELALRVYRSIVEDSLSDSISVDRLAELYERHGRLAELLWLRQRELELSLPQERRLLVRVEVARLLGLMEERGRRIEVLRANLQERPGHEDSVRALTAILEQKGKTSELVDLLADQAQRTEVESPGQSARLWFKVAEVAARDLHQAERAITALRRVVALEPNPVCFEMLARLHHEREEHAQEAAWFERRVEYEVGAARTPWVQQLAAARVKSGRTDRAIVALERALADDGTSLPLREQLAALYRSAEAYEPLAKLLRESALLGGQVRLDIIKEAVEIYRNRLGKPELAVPMLEAARANAEADVELALGLADGYRAAGRLDEAGQILTQVLKDYGRRKPPQRAQAHYVLAQVLSSKGESEAAMVELEEASSIDSEDANILRALGELAVREKSFERGERAYRALLLLVRRGERKDGIGVSEVFYRLSELARAKGDERSAQELLESAVEAAQGSVEEAQKFTRVLIASGTTSLAKSIVERRLGAAQSAEERARALADRAEVELIEGNAAQALASLFEAIEQKPTPAVLDAARKAAQRSRAAAQYYEVLSRALEKNRRTADAEEQADLLLRLAEVAERDLNDVDRAYECYARVEGLKVRLVETWRALARLSAQRGDHVEEIRVLRRLLAVGAGVPGQDGIPEDAKTEALYRIAEVELAADDSFSSGVSTVDEAVTRDRNHRRAATLLANAPEKPREHDEFFSIWSREARLADDQGLLLSFLEYALSGSQADLQMVREAYELAIALGQDERATKVLERGAEVARDSVEGLAAAVWIPETLAERAKARGDAAAAMGFLQMAADAAEQVGDFAAAKAHHVAALELGHRADADAELAGAILRKLTEQDPKDRELWNRARVLYELRRDWDGFGEYVDFVLDLLFEPDVRNELRLLQAKLELSHDARQEHGEQVLRDILNENPDHIEAAATLSELLLKAGREDDVAELVDHQLMRAREAGDREAIARFTERKAEWLSKSDPRGVESLYREALELAPGHPVLVKGLLRVLGDDVDLFEKARLLEALLPNESEASLPASVLAAADLYAQLGESDAAERVVAFGWRALPLHEGLRERYRTFLFARGDFHAVLEQILHQVDRESDPGKQIALLREAVDIQRNTLGDLDASTALLRRARVLAPADVALADELVAVLLEQARLEEAEVELGQILALYEQRPDISAHLLSSRGEVRLRMGDHAGAVRDYETAYAVRKSEVAEGYVQALVARRADAEKAGDATLEREVVLRLAEVLRSEGQPADAKDILTTWYDAHQDDIAVLRELLSTEREGNNAMAVVRLAPRLIDHGSGEEQVQGALWLVEAATQLGQPKLALAGLEQALSQHPSERSLRDALGALYAADEDWGNQARLLLLEADEATGEARVQLIKRASELLIHRAEQADRALAPLRELVREREDDQEATVLLGDALISVGEFDEAIQLLHNCVNTTKKKRTPHVAIMQQRLGYIAGISGDGQTQLEWLRAAFESDKSNGAIASELAELALGFGDDETAMSALKVITLLKNPGPMSKAIAFLKQAQIAHKQGDTQKAILWARRAKMEDPQLAEAQEFLVFIGDVH